MFLIRFSTLTLLVSVISFAAQANYGSLQVGKYVRTEGQPQLCEKLLDIDKTDLNAKQISFGAAYVFEQRTSTLSVESDLDPDCMFSNESQRSDSGDQTVLIRKNSETCKGVVKSETIARATIQGNTIRVELEEKQEGTSIPGLSCVWTRK